MKHSTHAARLGVLTLAMVTVVLSVPAHGDVARDPTMPPAAALPPPTALDPSATTNPPGPLSVIVRDGKPFVVKGTRLYGQGQMLGDARIERISETEVWLREGKRVTKLQLFSGIERRPASGVPGAPGRK